MAVVATCVTVVLAPFVSTAAGNAANPDAIEHDMLLDKRNPRWKGYVKHGSKLTATLADTLPKDVIICDWQYFDMKEKNKEWPTMAYFKEKGFPLAGCPWWIDN